MTATDTFDMAANTFSVTAEATVSVEIRNPDVIDRIVGPGGHEWRSQFYSSIKTAEDVAAHFAFNALTNGIYDVDRLEGWADCARDDVEIIVSEITTEASRV